MGCNSEHYPVYDSLGFILHFKAYLQRMLFLDYCHFEIHLLLHFDVEGLAKLKIFLSED